MNPLESDWFFQMVERGGKTPSDQLLAVFSVTENWMAAPGIRETFFKNYAAQQASLQTCIRLRNFLARLATAARMEKPEILASHIVILLQGAIVEELRNPGIRAMAEAAKAAQAVIAHARPHRQGKRYALISVGSIAATLLVTLVSWHAIKPAATPPMTGTIVAVADKTMLLPTGLSPAEMDAIMDLQEQIEKGACPAPHLLVLPQGQATAYMNAINLRTPENPAADRENIRAFLAWFKQHRSSECYYAPQNGHTSVAWTKG